MYAYIQGKITEYHPTYVVLDCGGVGYGLHISLYTAQAIKNKEQAKLYTHLYVREDDQRLYGFVDKTERQVFRLLISVSGIGTNTAMIILSSMSPKQVQSSILTDDVHTFKSVKGIGPKTAKRIILDLKDKMSKIDNISEDISIPSANNTTREEALSALVHLGFKQKDVLQAFKQIQHKDDSVESLIKKSLGVLSK